MPCRSNRVRVVIPLDVPSELQWAYDTARPLDDDEVKKVHVDSGAVIAEDNVFVEVNELPTETATRQVPYYYDCAEEEDAYEEADPALDVQTQTTTTTPPSSCTLASAVATVEMPNVELLVHDAFPTTSAMPPPPPTTTGSAKAVALWYRRLVAHPVYEQCVRFLSCECPPPPPDEDAEAVQMWMSMCDRWWGELSAFVARTSLPYRLPAEMMWNPYSLTESVRYRKVSTRRAGVLESAHTILSSARYLLPPPPSYAMVMGEYRMIGSEEEATRGYLDCLTVWWCRACEWAAASQRRHAWVCPPPTTGANAADWARRCEEWRSFTDMQLCEEDRRAKALELQSLLAAFHFQQQLQQQTTLPPFTSAASSNSSQCHPNHTGCVGAEGSLIHSLCEELTHVATARLSTEANH